MLIRLKWFTSRITLTATYRLLSMDVLLGHDPKMGDRVHPGVSCCSVVIEVQMKTYLSAVMWEREARTTSNIRDPHTSW